MKIYTNDDDKNIMINLRRNTIENDEKKYSQQLNYSYLGECDVFCVFL